MIIAANKVVKMHYSVMDNDKNSIDNSFDGEPLIFIVGTGYLIQGLEDALQGKKRATHSVLLCHQSKVMANAMMI